jgi:hypothetical protein
MCLLKHSLGACTPVASLLEPREFVHRHVDLVISGLALPPEGSPAVRNRAKR